MDVERVVEVWADVTCPFTHVSFRRFSERRDLLGAPEVRLRVRAWPLELVNDAPVDADLIGEEVPQIRHQAAPDLFAGFDARRLPRSVIGLLGMCSLAYEESLEVGEALNLAVRNALFEDGASIGDPDFVASIAAAHGVAVPDADRSRQAVEDDWAAGREKGVEGSPTFFVGSQKFFCPTLDIQNEDGVFRVRDDPDAIRRFNEAVFG